MKRTEEIEIRLPEWALVELRAIAKLAGLSLQSVMRLAIATQVRKWQNEVEPQT